VNVNASELETAIRSAPPWLLITIAGLLVIMMIAAGPFAGWCLERKRTAPERAYTRAAAAKWIETGEVDLTELRAEERAKLRLRPAQSAQGKGSGVYRSLSKPVTEATEPDPVVVIRDDRPTSIITVVANASTTTIPTPDWAEEPTQGWEILEPAANVFDAEIVEEGDDGFTEEERQFLADPLGSWLLPPLDEFDFLPTADEAVSFLVQADLLTGEGIDIDTEWAAWNLYASETEGAMA
jgi:hypothetical protein